jgi:hypothetical protein
MVWGGRRALPSGSARPAAGSGRHAAREVGQAFIALLISIVATSRLRSSTTVTQCGGMQKARASSTLSISSLWCERRFFCARKSRDCDSAKLRVATL